LLAPPAERGTLMADILANLGGFVLQKVKTGRASQIGVATSPAAFMELKIGTSGSESGERLAPNHNQDASPMLPLCPLCERLPCLARRAP